MDFSHHIMHTIQHIIKCEQDIMAMMHQMFLFLTIRQLWRSIVMVIPFSMTRNIRKNYDENQFTVDCILKKKNVVRPVLKSEYL